MRKMFSGLLVAIAAMAANTLPASACSGCWGCGYASPCAAPYAQPNYGCASACGAAIELLPDPELQSHSVPLSRPQYYYVNQGPTFTGPGDLAPLPFYDEGVTARRVYHRHHRYRPVLHSYY
jgi:hypothetical protein